MNKYSWGPEAPDKKGNIKMKKFFKTVLDTLAVLVGLKSRSAVNDGIVDYSGQGRDKYGN